MYVQTLFSFKQLVANKNIVILLINGIIINHILFLQLCQLKKIKARVKAGGS